MRVAILDVTGLLVADITQVDDVGDIAAIGGVLCPDDVNIGWAYAPGTGTFSIPAGSDLSPPAGGAVTSSSMVAVMTDSAPPAGFVSIPIKATNDPTDHANDVYGEAIASTEALGLLAQSTKAGMRTSLELDNFRQSGANNGGFGSTAGTGIKFRLRGAIDWASGNTYGLYVDPGPPDGASAYIGVYSLPVLGAAPAQTVITGFQAALPAVSTGAIGNVYGFYATASLGSVGSSVNCGYRGSLGAGATNWNLYLDGAAPNYMVGNLGIGASVPTCSLDVRGPVRCGSYTRTTVPSASVVGAGAMIWVTNPASGVARAFWSTGTDWRDSANVAA